MGHRRRRRLVSPAADTDDLIRTDLTLMVRDQFVPTAILRSPNARTKNAALRDPILRAPIGCDGPLLSPAPNDADRCRHERTERIGRAPEPAFGGTSTRALRCEW